MEIDERSPVTTSVAWKTVIGALGVFALILVVGGALSVGGAVFSTVLPDAPLLELPDDAISAEMVATLDSADPPTVFAVKPARLDGAGPRLTWAVAVGLNQLGQAMFVLLVMAVMWKARSAVLFGEEVNRLVRWWWIPALPIVLGSTMQTLTKDWVAGAFDLPLADTEATAISIFDFPSLAVLVVAALAFAWSRGRELQKFEDGAV